MTSGTSSKDFRPYRLYRVESSSQVKAIEIDKIKAIRYTYYSSPLSKVVSFNVSFHPLLEIKIKKDLTALYPISSSIELKSPSLVVQLESQ